MQPQNIPYGLLSVFAFILAGAVYAYTFVSTSGAVSISSFNNSAGFLGIFFIVAGIMLSVLFFAKKI